MLHRRSRALTTALGLLVLVQGLGKAADPEGYVQALAAFPLVPSGLAAPLGALWIVLELVSGPFLMAGGLARRPHRARSLAAAVGALVAALGYTALTFHAFLLGVPIDNCTCFGIWLPQRLSGWVLLQDVSVLLWVRTQLRSISRWRS